MIIEAPPFIGDSDSAVDDEGRTYDAYMLYNRAFLRTDNLAPMAGSVAKRPRSACTRRTPLPTQTVPNT